MLVLITFLLCGLFGYSLGKTSNGMTSPRGAFNFFTAPFAAVLGALIGLIYTAFGGSLGANVLTAAFWGAFAGFVGLLIARARR